MERKETIEILKAVATYYPKFKIGDPQTTLNAWHDVLQEYEFEPLMANLKNYVKNNRFPPSVADIIDIAPASDRAIPDYEETRRMIAKWDQERANKSDPETAKKHLADMRKILGIKRGE